MKNKAVEILNDWRKENDGTKSAVMIIDELIGRCGDSAALAEDVCQDGKSWKGCWDYIVGLAKKQAVNNAACIEDTMVYEWAEDYFHQAVKPAPEVKTEPQKTKKRTTPRGPELIRQTEEKNINGQMSLF